MVDAHTRVFITNPDDWDDWIKMEGYLAEHPELACPPEFNSYGLIKQIQVGDKILCSGRDYWCRKREGDKSPDECLTCEKYAGRETDSTWHKIQQGPFGSR